MYEVASVPVSFVVNSRITGFPFLSVLDALHSVSLYVVPGTSEYFVRIELEILCHEL